MCQCSEKGISSRGAIRIEYEETDFHLQTRGSASNSKESTFLEEVLSYFAITDEPAMKTLILLGATQATSAIEIDEVHSPILQLHNLSPRPVFSYWNRIRIV